MPSVEDRLRNDDAHRHPAEQCRRRVIGGLATADLDALERLIRLNITAVVRLAGAVVPRFAAAGDGAIINVSSVLALGAGNISWHLPGDESVRADLLSGAAGRLSAKGVYVQAVLPAATRTEIWQRGGMDITAIPGVMAVDELVDAALVGFDRKELITIPPLPDEQQWTPFEAARQAMRPNFRQEHPAARYRHLIAPAERPGLAPDARC